MTLYSLLLLAYPSEFRHRYGAAMRQAFRDRRRDAIARGWLARAAFWRATVADVATNAWAERRAGRPRRGAAWQGIGRDVRHALRGLVRQPGLTAMVIVTLGLGVGANTAVFSTVRGLVLQPLAFPDPDRLVQLSQGGGGRNAASAAAGVEWAARTDLFDGVGTYVYTSANLTSVEPAERIPVARVSGEFLETLGIDAAMGRTLRPGDALEGATPVVVISHAFWQRRFDGDLDVLDRTVRLGTDTLAVVGVMPQDVEHLSWRGADLWVPLVLDPAQLSASYRVVARLAPGVTSAAAAQALSARAAELSREFGEDAWPPGVAVVGLHESIVGDASALVLATQTAAALVLLMACANLANLLLARSTARRREFAVRTALGARRSRLVRQLLVESLALSLAGGAAGVLFAAWAVGLIVAAAPADMPRLDQIRMDGVVLVAGFGIAAITGVVFGLVPALRLSSTGTDAALASGDRSGGAALRQRPLRWLIVAEVAIAVVLLAVSGGVGRTLLAMQQVDVGLRTADVVAAEMSLPTAVYPTGDAQRAMFARIVERTLAVPGVTAAGFVDTLPLSQSWSQGRYRLEEGDEQSFLSMNYRATAEYFGVVGIPVLSGRLFNDSDAGGPNVVIVSRLLARSHWPDGDAVGRRVWLSDGADGVFPFDVIGVVGDVHHTGLDDGPQPSMYLSTAQLPASRGVLVARVAGDPHDLIGPIRRAVAELDPSLPLFNTRSVGDLRTEALSAARLFTTLIGATALLALTLGVVGVYGIVAFGVAARRRETGVRLALGATPWRVARLFLVEGLRLTGLGVMIGLVAFVGIAAVAGDAPFSDPARDALMLVLTSGVLVVAALVACYVPAVRVLRIDPSDIMRAD